MYTDGCIDTGAATADGVITAPTIGRTPVRGSTTDGDIGTAAFTGVGITTEDSTGVAMDAA